MSETSPRLVNYPPPSGGTLPANATTLEIALDIVEGERLWGTIPDLNGTTGLKRQVPFIWDPENCPAEWLPLLAWSMRLDFFDTGWPERFQRDMVKNARRINELRGTVAGIKLMLSLLGHPNAEVVERLRLRRRGDGTIRNGEHTRNARSEWATFRIVLTNPISIKQAAILRTAIDRVKRNCCVLVEFDFSNNPLLRGLGYVRGGGYTRGTV